MGSSPRQERMTAIPTGNTKRRSLRATAGIGCLKIQNYNTTFFLQGYLGPTAKQRGTFGPNRHEVTRKQKHELRRTRSSGL